ncbi:hypothetical protein CVT26_000511, partial [Gymnopilus dilepis]
MPRAVAGEIRVVSFNIQKNYMYMDVFLESNVDAFDIVFIQEPPWRHIRTAPSAHNKEGEDVVVAYAASTERRAPQGDRLHLNALEFLRNRPAIRRDLMDHRDLLLLSLFAEGSISYLLNVYSDAEHTAIRFLADKQDVIPQLNYMGGDFNCHSSVWDGNVPHHRTTPISLLHAAASLGLDLALPFNPGPTHYPHDERLRPSVIDLIFVHPQAALSSNFLSDITDSIKDINVAMLEPNTPDQVDALAKAIASVFRGAWEEHAREVFNTNRSKPWWNAEESGNPSDFNTFRKVCRKTKRIFFNSRIHEIASTNKR